jgi:hypothetical protein
MLVRAGRDDPGRPAVDTAEGGRARRARAAAELKVTIEAPATRRPGERAAIAVRLRDHRDRPVQGDGHDSGPVDEGLLALTSTWCPTPSWRCTNAKPRRVGFSDSRLQLLKRSLPKYMGDVIQDERG